MDFIEVEPASGAGWWLAYAIQQMFVPVGSLLATFVTSSALRSTAGSETLLGWLAAFICYTTPAASAFAAGRYIAIRPRWAGAGKAIWFAPFCLFAFIILWGMFADPAGTVKTFFVADSKDGDTESGLGLILFTFPVVACCAYSAAIKMAERRALTPKP